MKEDAKEKRREKHFHFHFPFIKTTYLLNVEMRSCQSLLAA
jgi:hypothetical protein